MCAAGVTSWVKTWKLNGWRLKSGGPIINKEDFVKLDGLNAQVEVAWVSMSLHHVTVSFISARHIKLFYILSVSLQL